MRKQALETDARETLISSGACLECLELVLAVRLARFLNFPQVSVAGTSVKIVEPAPASELNLFGFRTSNPGGPVANPTIRVCHCE